MMNTTMVQHPLNGCGLVYQVYDIDHCVWCGKGEDTKNPNRQKGKLLRIEQTSSWNTFKRHPVYLEDDLRD